MKSRRKSVVWMLAGINLILAASLVASTISLPQSFAQAGRGGGDYLAVAGKAPGRNYDVLWVLDISNQRLQAFYPGLPQRGDILHTEPRDIKKDFGKQ